LKNLSVASYQLSVQNEFFGERGIEIRFELETDNWKLTGLLTTVRLIG